MNWEKSKSLPNFLREFLKTFSERNVRYSYPIQVRERIVFIGYVQDSVLRVLHKVAQIHEHFMGELFLIISMVKRRGEDKKQLNNLVQEPNWLMPEPEFQPRQPGSCACKYNRL